MGGVLDGHVAAHTFIWHVPERSLFSCFFWALHEAFTLLTKCGFCGSHGRALVSSRSICAYTSTYTHLNRLPADLQGTPRGGLEGKNARVHTHVKKKTMPRGRFLQRVFVVERISPLVGTFTERLST